MTTTRRRSLARVRPAARSLTLAAALWVGPGAVALAEPAAAADSAPTLTLEQTSQLPEAWGTTYRGTITSDALREQRVVHLYVPESFSRTQRHYPVVYLTDGEYNFEDAAIAARELSLAGHTPECIVAAVETPRRRQDLTPPGMSASLSDGEAARGEELLTFIARELRPQLESTMRAGAPSVLVGHSHGAALCAYAAANWRHDFPFVLSLDAPMNLDRGSLADLLIESVKDGGPLRLVSLEVKFGWTDEDWSRLRAAAPAGWTLVRRRLDREAHETMVFPGLYEGLKELFSDYSFVNDKGATPEEALRRYEGLATVYGASCTPPESVLRHALMNLTARGKADDARRALRALIVGYGEPDDAARLAAAIDEAESALRGKESVEEMLASAPPTAAEIAPFVGVWRGVSWLDLDADRKQRLVVTFSIKDGHGVATIQNPDAPAEYRDEAVSYLRVTPEGIEFGNMNGMYPPGIVARVGRLRGDTLEGEAVFKGVYFRYPEGMTPPHHMFSLVRE